MLGVDHDKNILLSTAFPTIPMLGINCWCNVIVFYVGNKRCFIVLYCIVLYCIVLYCIVWHDWSCNWSCHLAIGGATRPTEWRSVVGLVANCPDLSRDFATGGTSNRTIGRRCHDSSCYPSPDATIDRTIDHRLPRLIVRLIAGLHD